ncbi:MAG TPA: helical backbone metal receptor [Vicinamibacterales bacterium]|nr:helical backbone metal receptor [Vicinamibacterales bacterium]
MTRRACAFGLLPLALIAVCLAAKPSAWSPARDATAQPATRPRRIISLVPAVTEMLYAIGAGDDVIGVSTFDHYPPAVESKTRVGALVDPDFERILSLSPDLVIIYGTQSDLATRLDHAHVPVFDYELAGLADVIATMRRLGDRIGRSTDANREADRIERELESVRRQVAGRPRPRTALIFGREAGSLRGIFASAGVGFLHDMLEVAGGSDAFADVTRQSLQLSAEMLLARAPDVILELRPSEGWSADRLASERGVWNALPSLPAVRTGRVYILADNLLLVPGPRVVEAVRRIAAVIQPGAVR